MTNIVAGLQELAEPWPSGSSVKEAIERASKACGLHAPGRRIIPYWRTFDIWYRKALRIRDFEYQAVETALEKKRKEAARNELHELRTRLAILESRLNQVDADFFSPTIDQAREQMRGLGLVDRSGGRR